MVGMLTVVLTLLNSQAHAGEATISTRYNLHFLSRNLDDTLDQTSAEGFYVAANEKGFCVQAIEGLSLNGTRAWSPFLSFYVFDEGKKEIFKGQAELSEIGKVHQPKLPSAITEADFDQMVALRQADGKLRRVAPNIASFRVQRPNPLSARMEVAAVVESGKYKDEEISMERTFFFSSAADL